MADSIIQLLEDHDRCPPQARDDSRRQKTACLIMQAIRPVTNEMIEAGLQHYSEGGCIGLTEQERREVVRDIIEAAIAKATPSQS